MGDYRILNNDRLGLVGELPKLSGLRCMRDTKIVCRDGHVMWNIALMSQWSKVIRLLMDDGGAAVVAADPLVLILPNVAKSTMEKLLEWSVEGRVTLNSQETKEFTTTLQAMGVCVEFSQRLIVASEDKAKKKKKGEDRQNAVAAAAPPAPPPPAVPEEIQIVQDSVRTVSEDKKMSGKSQSQIPVVPLVPIDTEVPQLKDLQAPKASKPKGRPRKEVAKMTSKKSSVIPVPMKKKKLPTKDLERKAEFNNNKGNRNGKKLLSCPLCPFKHGMYCRVARHVSQTHYRKELLAVWNNSDLHAPCFICHKPVLKADMAKADKYKKECFVAAHIGQMHDKLFDVASAEVRKSLQEMKLGQHYVRGSGRQTWQKCLAAFKKLHGGSCEVCAAQDIPDPRALRAHLAHDHFSEQLAARFSSGDGGNKARCKLCGYVASQEEEEEGSAALSYTAAHHISVIHGRVLFSLLPKEVASLLRTCLIAKPPQEKKKLKVAIWSKKRPRLASEKGKPSDVEGDASADNLEINAAEKVEVVYHGIDEGDGFDDPDCDMASPDSGTGTNPESLLSSQEGSQEGILGYSAPSTSSGSNQLTHVTAKEFMSPGAPSANSTLNDVSITSDAIAYGNFVNASVNNDANASVKIDAPANEDTNCFSCPICDKDFKHNTYYVVRHLATSHFRDALHDAVGLPPGSRMCPVCNQEKANGLTVLGKIQRTMAEHVGLAHRYLEQVVDDGLRPRVAAMMAPKRPGRKSRQGAAGDGEGELSGVLEDVLAMKQDMRQQKGGDGAAPPVKKMDMEQFLSEDPDDGIASQSKGSTGEGDGDTGIGEKEELIDLSGE